VTLARRIGKKHAWLLSIAINTGAFVGVFFLGPGDALIYGVLVFLSGIGLGATLALPSSIQADVIDYDELLTGERREGRYIGLWSIAKKLAAAVGVGAGLSILVWRVTSRMPSSPKRCSWRCGSLCAGTLGMQPGRPGDRLCISYFGSCASTHS